MKFPTVFSAPSCAGLFAAALFALGHTAPVAAQASAFEQVPGVYRQQIGDLRVTALFDGVVPLPLAMLHGVPSLAVRSQTSLDHVPKSAAGVQTAVNAYVVEDGQARVLVDAGAGNCLGPSMGRLPDNLRAAGIEPESITAVLLTHAHPDHVCGVLDHQGRPAFAQATLWLAEEDLSFVFSDVAKASAPEAFRPMFDLSRRALSVYADLGRLQRLGAGGTLPGGAIAVPSVGHTPGHTSFRFDSAGQSLLVWGDIVHFHAVQFTRPSASFEADFNRSQAITSRKALMAKAATRGWWVAGAHLPFPGVGHVRARSPSSFTWVPVEFGPVAGAQQPVRGK